MVPTNKNFEWRFFLIGFFVILIVECLAEVIVGNGITLFKLLELSWSIFWKMGILLLLKMFFMTRINNSKC